MKNVMRLLPVISMLAILSMSLPAQPIPTDSLYLGQTPPGKTPKIFAPGIVSLTGRIEYGISISPDGKEMLFATGDWPNKRTSIMEYKNDHWSSPVLVSFSKTRSAEEAIFSPDGKRVYYYAYNAPNSFGAADLCYSEKVDSVWSDPINLGSSLNTSEDEYHPCVVADGSIYFENTSGQIYYSKYENGTFQPRVKLPSIFNDAVVYGNPYVSPDESYFIFNSTRAGGFGNNDLYISYKKNDGTWTNPKNLGNIFNTQSDENGSEITSDGLYMTYVSNNDIYWVSTSFIDSLRHTNFPPYLKYQIPNQKDTVGHSFDFTIPDSTFFDDDPNSTFTFSARLSNGGPWPSWLNFNSGTGTFSGIPTQAKVFPIMVTITARDTANASASATFGITIVANPVDVEEDKNQLPQNINLSQNYPNPFNPTTTIEFAISKTGRYTLGLYDTLGELVKEISNKEYEAGYYKETFNAAGLSSGMYIYRLSGANVNIIRKMVLLR